MKLRDVVSIYGTCRNPRDRKKERQRQRQRERRRERKRERDKEKEGETEKEKEIEREAGRKRGKGGGGMRERQESICAVRETGARWWQSLRVSWSRCAIWYPFVALLEFEENESERENAVCCSVCGSVWCSV